MPIAKLPINSSRGPLCGPTCGSDVAGSESVSTEVLFDFRSSRFADDAMTLARTTGRALARCREALFIAEGDMGLAYTWLVSGYHAQADGPFVH